jgi:hypothetical protein
MTKSGPGVVLRLEDLGVLVCSTLAYAMLDAGWLMFVVLFLVPDGFMLGYVWNQKIGSIIYNIGHSYVTPLLLASFGYAIAMPKLYPIALIWVAHIGFDRLIGYGLKYAEGFKSTHLGRV